MNMRNTTAFVTGASRGIGRALVDVLLSRGVKKIYATARTQTGMDTLTAIQDPRLVAVMVDISDPVQVARAAAQGGDVNLLINNAGQINFGSILEASIDDVRANMETNYYGTLNVIRAFAPVIEANGGGAVVNLLSIVALASMPGLAAYNASKAAAWSMTQSVRADLRTRGIVVHGVYPGPVDTDMLNGVEIDKAAPQDVAEAIVGGVEQGVEDIFPDDVSKGAYAAWCQDHKAVEAQFSTM